jgi:hypothetical protein
MFQISYPFEPNLFPACPLKLCMIAVFNHPRNLDHVVVNPNNPKEIKISNEEIEIQTSVVIDHDASIQSF